MNMPAATVHSGLPAFTSLLPQFPELLPADPLIAEIVASYCGRSVSVQTLGLGSGSLEGRYVVRAADSGQFFFLKIFPDSILELQLHSNRVARYLAKYHVPVVQALEAEPRPVSPGYFGMLFPFLDARFSCLSAKELGNLGRSLARMHTALASYPDHGAVESAGAQMDARLLDIARSIREGWFPSHDAEDIAKRAAKEYCLADFRILKEPQMVHGDCNYTNVLFDRWSDAEYIIDFEESYYSWLSPLFDIGKVIERFILVAPEQDAAGLATALFSGYVEGGGELPANTDYVRLLRESNLRSVLILCDKIREGLAIPSAELEKFKSLDRMACQRSSFLGSLRELSEVVQQAKG